MTGTRRTGKTSRTTPSRRRTKAAPAVRNDPTDTGRAGRKERVIHTRVPAVLDRELKHLATSLKLPVSNLVRAILEDALEAVDAVGKRAEGELHGMAERLSRHRDALRQKALAATSGRARDLEALETARPGASGDEAAKPEAPTASCPSTRPALLDGVVGFEKLVLAADVPCTVCGRLLRAGETAHRAVSDRPGPRVMLGRDCRLVPGGARKEEER